MTGVGFEIHEERVVFNSIERHVFLAVRSVNPGERIFQVTTISVGCGDPLRPPLRMRFLRPRERRVGLGLSVQRVIHEGEPHITCALRSRLLHL